MTTMMLLIIVAGIVCGAAWLTHLVRRFALKKGILDRPNARSSHTSPTARGGGIAIVLVVSTVVSIFSFIGLIESRLALSLLVGGGAISLVGYLDDRGTISVVPRILVHFIAAALAVWWVGGLHQLDFGTLHVSLGTSGAILSVLGIVWSINLFNFMDGIDGIAASEAIIVAALGAGLTALAGGSLSAQYAAVVVAAATLGFLLWNWPPARIFMGDVGSGYLGFALAVLALAATKDAPRIFNAWLILYAAFIVDATVTLARRLLRMEPVYEAHRSHAYQWLARRWGSHARVTLLLNGVNLLWLAPLAWGCVVKPEWTAWWLLAALVPLGVMASLAGAGRKEL